MVETQTMPKKDPYHSLTREQELIFLQVFSAFRRLGYVVMSEPHEGMEQQWLDGLCEKLERAQTRFEELKKFHRTRGYSLASRYNLTTAIEFDPGFGIHVSSAQKEDNRKYKKMLDRGVARFDAANNIPPSHELDSDK